MNDDTSPYIRLSRVAGDDWQIGRELGMLTALWRSADGHRMRYIVAPTARELADRITRAEAEASEQQETTETANRQKGEM
jgi:hypothetical protein